MWFRSKQKKKKIKIIVPPGYLVYKTSHTAVDLKSLGPPAFDLITTD